jgi:hypothetical protein
MSLESKIDDLIAALDANTKALAGGAKTSTDKVKDDPKDEPKSERAPRGSRASREEKPKDGVTEAELKETVSKFLDQPENKEGDAEYEKRLSTVIDPVFDKAGVKELADLPEKYWPDLLDAIASYGKAAEGGTRRGRNR